MAAENKNKFINTFSMDFFSKMSPKQAQNVNGLVLAYVGDAVQSLWVRQQLATRHDFTAGTLHSMASAQVNAHSQSQMAQILADVFTDEERAIYLRGRNGKSHHKAKNASGADYRKATGLEAVIGYLYLIGNYDRIAELLTYAHSATDVAPSDGSAN